jgi:beta-lactamase superfamily II metal-dependent hydrolase
MSNKAKDIIIPEKPHIFRTVFLYVGQGDSTLLAIPHGENYKYVLIDSNYDENSGGIDILELLKDLFSGENNKLDVYINTHPHKDHLSRVKEIYKQIGINQLWHSGHKPGGDHKEAYEDLDYVIKDLGEANVYILKGSREDNKLDDMAIKLGDINYNVLAPAEYVADEVADEKPETRYQRIHEQCGVIRFKYGSDEKQILITGDAGYDAWKEHITDFHKDRLPSTVLSAAHHGSNSFFWKNSDTNEKPYEKHLEKINPTYIVVSAPKSKESKHGHPDKEAMNLYKEKVGENNVFHFGDKRECVIVDIEDDGSIDVYPDNELVENYGTKNGNNGGGKGESISSAAVITGLDKKPMGV